MERKLKFSSPKKDIQEKKGFSGSASHSAFVAYMWYGARYDKSREPSAARLERDEARLNR